MSDDIRICTQMPLPQALQSDARRRAIAENPNNERAHNVLLQEALASSPADVPPGLYLALPYGRCWDPGRVLRIKFLSGSAFVRGKIHQYALAWQPWVNLKFDFIESGLSDIRIACNSSGASWSYVGTDCSVIPQSDKTMQFGWFDEHTTDREFARTVIHEFGHALGCIHEHQNPLANIPWNRDRVYSYYKEKYGWSRERVDHNIFAVYAKDMTQYSHFDPTSVMIYAIPSQLTTNGLSVAANGQLSHVDKRFIASVYPGGVPASEQMGAVSFKWLGSGKDIVNLYYQKGDDTIQELVFNEEWRAGAKLPTGVSGTAVAAVAWNNGNEVRVYYQDASYVIKEMCFSFSLNRWYTGATLPVAAKGASIAAVQWGQVDNPHIRVYYQGADNAIYEHCFDNGWYSGKKLTSLMPAIQATAIAAVQWSDGTHIRVYYQGTDNAIHEYCFDFDNGWYSGPTLAVADEGSSIAAVQWGNGTQLRLYYQGIDNIIYEHCFVGQWAAGARLGMASPESALAAVHWQEAGGDHISVFSEESGGENGAIIEHSYANEHWLSYPIPGHEFKQVPDEAPDDSEGRVTCMGSLAG